MKEYKFTPADGMETTVLLSDEDAKVRGLKASDSVEAVKAKADQAEADAEAAKRAAEAKAAHAANKQAAPANKAAAPANKGDG